MLITLYVFTVLFACCGWWIALRRVKEEIVPVLLDELEQEDALPNITSTTGFWQLKILPLILIPVLNVVIVIGMTKYWDEIIENTIADVRAKLKKEGEEVNANN